jgi:hypothetical protein
MSRVFFYYAFCSVKNQIKKLFKSWFLIFLIACMLFGALVGLGIGFLSESFGDEAGEEEPLPEEDFEELTPEEIETVKATIEGGVAALTLVFLFFGAISADKDASKIFNMADVNLLFSAPKKPQSVLLFKILTQIFAVFFVSIYFFIEIPILVDSLELNFYVGIAILFAWFFIIVYQKLLNILLYTLSSTHPRVKKFLRPTAFAVLGVILLIYMLFYTKSGNAYTAFLDTFSSPATRYIPVFGWIKGFVMWGVEGNYVLSAVFFVLLSVGVVLSAYGIWHIRADFYEDAMSNSQKTNEAITSAQSGAVARRDKDRSDKILRDGFNRGSGANVFFFKSLYNRRRFSHLGFLTKTAETYLILSVLASVVLRFTYTPEGSPFFIIGLGLVAMVFFRSLGNPISHDMDKTFFVTVPASSHEKVFFSLASGTLDTALDTLPAVVVSALVLGASPLETVAFYLLLIAVDFYASNVMLFIELSLPSSLSLQIKQMITVLFIYFGLIPIAAILLVGFVLGLFDVFLFIASLVALFIGAIFFIFSPIFLDKGRK